MTQSHIAKRYHIARQIWNIRAGNAARVYNNKPELYDGLLAKSKQSKLLFDKISARLQSTPRPTLDKYALGEYDKKGNRSYSD